MTRCGSEVLASFFQAGHPGDGQVTVLQTHPRSLLHSCGDHLRCDGALALAQGDGLELGSVHALVIGKLQ